MDVTISGKAFTFRLNLDIGPRKIRTRISRGTFFLLESKERPWGRSP